MWDEEYGQGNDRKEDVSWCALAALVLTGALMWAAIIKGLILLDSYYDFTGWVLSAIGRLS